MRNLFPGPGLGDHRFARGARGRYSYQYNNWSDQNEIDSTDYLQVNVNLKDFSNLRFHLAEWRNRTGIREFEIHYSVDSSVFLPIDGSVTVVGDNERWRFHEFDLCSIPAINDKSNVSLRIYGHSAERVANAWRFDNILLKGCRSRLNVNHNNLKIQSPVGSSEIDSIILEGNDLKENVQLMVSEPFLISLDGVNFYDNLEIPKLLAEGLITIFIKFEPILDTVYNDTLEIRTEGEKEIVLLKGLSGGSIVPVYQIQGPGNFSPYEDQIVTTNGVVTAVFQDSNELKGFFIQDVVGDGDTETSDGIFVFNSDSTVNKGDFLRIKGKVKEFFEKAELVDLEEITVLGPVGLPSPVQVQLPLDSVGELERYE